MPFLGKNFKKNKEKKEKIKSEKNKNGVSSVSFGRTDAKVNTRNKEFSNRGGNVFFNTIALENLCFDALVCVSLKSAIVLAISA